MTGVLLALAASGAWGVSDFVAGVRTRTVALTVVMLLSQLAGLLVLVATLAVVAPSTWSSLGGPGRSLLTAAAAGAVGTAALGLLYLAMTRVGIIVVAPVSAGAAAVPVVLDLTEGHALGLRASCGVGLALAGILAAAAPRRLDGVARPRPDGVGWLAAGGSALCSGAFFVLLHDASGAIGPMAATLTTRLAGAVLVTTWALGRWPDLRGVRALRPAAVGAVALVGAGDAAAELCFATASGHTALGIVTPLSSLYPAVSVVLAVVLLRERPGRLGAVGVAAAVAGVVVLSG